LPQATSSQGSPAGGNMGIGGRHPDDDTCPLTFHQSFFARVDIWSMRSWESARPPKRLEQGTDSQDRMDQEGIVGGSG
jgi:hypothetical protein